MKKTVLLINLLIFAIIANAQQPKLVWAKYLGKTKNQIGSSVVIDSAGNIYITGLFTGKVDFDPGEGEFNLASTDLNVSNPLNRDIFILKLDKRGNFVWAKRLGNAEDDYTRSMILDEFKNIYITGAFRGKVDFDPGPGIFNLTTPKNCSEIFILKLDPSGNFIWAKNMAASPTLISYKNCGASITTDASGNVYTTGTFEQTVDFDPGIENFYLNASAFLNGDIFISKLDRSGNFVWAKKMGGTEESHGVSISLDQMDNLYIAGYFKGYMDFDPDSGVFNIAAKGAYNSDIFISKLDVNGNFIWAQSFGHWGWDAANSVCVGNSGNVYVSGIFNEVVDFDPGPGVFNLVSAGYSDMFILKLDTSGNFVWAKQIGGVSDNDHSTAMVLDLSDNIYSTGVFKGNVDFDPGADSFKLVAATTENMFIVKLDASGNFIWASSHGGSTEFSSSAIILDASEDIYTTGYFSGTQGSRDIFIHKMSTKPEIITPDFYKDLIYPNPSNGLLNIVISIPPSNFNNVQIEIYNNLGTLIHKESTLKQLNVFDLSNQTSGLYFVRVLNNNNFHAFHKLIKI